jgi:hypothetical protein
MAAGWIEAVRDLWVQDSDIDFAALETAWKLKTFETGGGHISIAEAASRPRLLCCLTGFEDGEQRQNMIETITANGANYTGDLTRKVTHLIVYKPEGKKYAAAKSWGVYTVAAEWLHDSVERGLILDEKCYDPVLPKEEIGKGAWIKREVKRVSLGKRLRDTAAAAEGEGKRKLRKTASMKLSSQRDNLWGDILGKPASVEPHTRADEEPTQLNPRASFTNQASAASFDTQNSKLASFGAMDEVPVFSACAFYVHGFPPRHSEIVVNFISSLGGLICSSLDDAASNSGAQMAHRFMIVPQTSPRDSYPTPRENIQVVTEFFVEKCMHKKRFFDPASHAIGRPFPVFPISGFEGLSISTAGFTGVDLNHMDKAIRQLGARYDERFKAQTSLLVCSSLATVRKQKLDLALQWKVPVVSANWLWTCISEGAKIPIKRFLFKELRQRFDFEHGDPAQEFEQPKPKKNVFEKQLRPEDSASRSGKLGVRGIDNAFAVDKPFPIPDAAAPPRKDISKEDSHTTAEFDTAPTHLDDDSAETPRIGAPLSEASSDSLNRPSPPQPRNPPAAPEPSTTSNAPTPVPAAAVRKENIPPPLPQTTTDKLAEAKAEAALAAKAASKAAERLALSARLTTLLDNPDHAVSAAAASTPTAPPGNTTAAATTRRRRQILGRAISNVSAASSASESPAPGGAATESGMADAADEGTAASGGGHGDGETQMQLSSTQIGYDDPEADAQKERLKGNNNAGRTRSAAQEKMTLASAGGYDVSAAGTGRAASMRSRRR